MEEPGFWDEPEESQKIMKDLKDLKDQVETVEHLEQSYEDIGLLIEMAYEEEDESVLPEIEEELNAFEEGYESLRIQTLLSGEYDKYNAIVTLHAGAGGTESCDWASMLYRMYSRFAERKGFGVKVLDFLEMWRGLRRLRLRSVVRMPMDILSLKKVYTAWCVFRHLILQERDRHHLHPVM